MKRSTILSFILLLTVTLFSQNSRAQDYLRWGLPEEALLRLGKGSTRAVAWSKDGTCLAVAGSFGIWFYDAHTGAEVSLLGPSGAASVAFSPDGQTLASGGGDDTVRLWDVATGQEIRTMNVHTRDVHSVAFSPDGQTLASGSGDKTVRLWDVATGQEKGALTEPNRLGRVGRVFAGWDDAGSRQW